MPAAKQTIDHDFIRRWTEERKGVPSTVKSTHREGETGVLRIDFKGESESEDRNLQPISWEEFFQKFEDAKLAFLYQEKTADGSPSRFFKLVKREPSQTGRRQAKAAAGATTRAAKGAAAKRETGKRKETATERKAPARGGRTKGGKSGAAGSKTTARRAGGARG